MIPSDATIVQAYSIQQLVEIHADRKTDRWRLSLVQRDAIWSDLQVAYLLDSLIWGYPIGSLLLCTVQQGGNVLVQRGGARHREEAPKGVFQLLDGQQRMNALAALFAGRENENRRYLLSLDMARDLSDLTRRRKSVKRSLRYIHIPDEHEVTEERWRWLDVTRLHKAWPSLNLRGELDRQDTPLDSWLDLASRIDSDCNPSEWESAPDEARRIAAERVKRLIRAWTIPSVPVVKLYLRDPTDVLQVFHRVNRTGTPVAGDDIFFAAVRTLWNDAEEHITEVSRYGSPREQEDTPLLLPPIDALRLLTRVASVLLEKGDVVPLDVERLRVAPESGGESEPSLIGKIMSLSADEAFLCRLRNVARQAADSSLGRALHEVPKRLLDPVFAWAARHPKEAIDEADLTAGVGFSSGG